MKELLPSLHHVATLDCSSPDKCLRTSFQVFLHSWLSKCAYMHANVCLCICRNVVLVRSQIVILINIQLIDQLNLTWCKPPGSEGQVRFPHSLLAAMTTPALCQKQPWQQAELGAMGACTYLKVQEETEVSERYSNYCGWNKSTGCKNELLLLTYSYHVKQCWCLWACWVCPPLPNRTLQRWLCTWCSPLGYQHPHPGGPHRRQ